MKRSEPDIAFDMSADKEKLLKLVNSSGFPFQLRVAKEIGRAGAMHNWHVIALEHPWRDADGQGAGFIDLVIAEHDWPSRMVIECKRTKDADWVFLIPKNTSSNGTHYRGFWVYAAEGALLGPFRSGWHNFYAEPTSYISEFCVVRGSGEYQRPMLERLCQYLLGSVESIGNEELGLAAVTNNSMRRYYIPVIVTNARLQVCSFDLGDVSLDFGEISESDFEGVPFIRFRKALSSKVSDDAKTIEAENRNQQRTVFVVDARHLSDFLNAWRMNQQQQEPAWY